jgi:hypothetical protein
MIDSARLKRLLLLAAVLFFPASGIALLAGSTGLAGGLLLGFGLGAAPFASWSWIAARGMKTARARALAIVLLVTKLGLYAGALYLFVTRKLVNPVGVFAGITGVVAILGVGALLAPEPSKETA